jgi:hypothetical protein
MPQIEPHVPPPSAQPALGALRPSAEPLAPDAASGGRLSIYICLLVLLFSCYAYVHQDYSGGTSISRLDLLQALFRYGTLSIDRYRGNTSDRARFDGHYYSDKAPGTVVAALPAFALAKVIERFEGTDHSSSGGYGGAWLESSWIATVGSVGLLTALGGVFFFAWIRRWVRPRYALVATLALFIGAMPFTYATMLFSHGMVAGLLAIALWTIARGGPPDSGRGLASLTGSANVIDSALTAHARRCDLLAGFCCGFVLASEYSAGLVVVGIYLWALALDRRRAMRMALGAIPSLLLIPAYSIACFHTPWAIGYTYHSTFPQMHRGLYGIQWPSAIVLEKYLVSPERGLFFWSPWFLMAIAGWPALLRRDRGLFWLTLLAPLATTIVMSGYVWDWRAGWTLGPRYLCPILPLLALPAALGTQRHPRLGTALAGLSMLLTGMGTLINATPRYEISNPLTQLHIPALFSGKLTYNLGSLCGLPGLWSLAPLAAVVAGYGFLLYRELDGSQGQPCEGPGRCPAGCPGAGTRAKGSEEGAK